MATEMIYALVPDELPPRALMGVSPSSSVADVRAAVLQAFGESGSPDSVSLSYNGADLDTGKTLADYGVAATALVRAELRR
jgi:hypothetical protein